MTTDLERTEPSDHVRKRPRAWMAAPIVIIHIAAVSITPLLWHSDDPSGTLRIDDAVAAVGHVAPSTLLIVAITCYLGWWRPAFVERTRLARPWTFLTVLAVLISAAAGVLILTGSDWQAMSAGFVILILVQSALIGFTEELSLRGLVLTALRARFSEPWVWFVSTAVFAALHGVNALFGASAGETVMQVCMAFLTGTLLYLVRRSTGFLVWGMVVHTLWDFVASMGDSGQVSESFQALTLGMMLGSVVATVVVITFFVRTRRSIGTPARGR